MDFPLAIMKSRNLITTEQHDAGMRFAALSWALYGEPFAGCEGLYERMVGSTDRGPIAEVDPVEAGKRRDKRRESLNAMLETLQRRDPILREPVESSRMRRIVKNVCQYATMPRWLVVLIDCERDSTGKLRYRVSDGVERALLIEGLQRLADVERKRAPSQKRVA